MRRCESLVLLSARFFAAPAQLIGKGPAAPVARRERAAALGGAAGGGPARRMMMAAAREKYEAMAVDVTATLVRHRQSDEAFQSDVREVQRMEADGLVRITKERRESESERRLNDLIIFTRLR